MKRSLIVAAMGGMLLSLLSANVAWSKAHVPSNRAQICAVGNVVIVSHKVLDAFLDRAGAARACILPACDFANVFTPASGCANIADTDDDGFCELPNPRVDAGGATAACPDGTF